MKISLGVEVVLQVLQEFSGLSQSIFLEQNGELVEFESELLRFGSFSFFLKALIDSFKNLVEIVEDVLRVFVGEVDFVVVQHLLQVGLLGLCNHLLVVLNFVLALFFVHRQVVGSVAVCLETDEVPQHNTHVDFVHVFFLVQRSLELTQILQCPLVLLQRHQQ
jgi:hypothetical protein